MADREVDAEGTSMTNHELVKWCKNNNLPYNEVDIQNLGKAKNRYAFIFTGNEPDDINNGNDHHWMFLDGKYIFDSYGNPNNYTLPEGFSILKNHPRQLQNFDTNVCGQYCCAFYYFTKANPDLTPEEIGEAYSDEYGLTKNRESNDEKILAWYNKTKTGQKQQADEEEK